MNPLSKRAAGRGRILPSDIRMPWPKVAEWFFWALGIILLATYAYVYLDRTVYQAYEEWAFQRALDRRPAPVIGFLWDSLWTGAHPVERNSVEDSDPHIRQISVPRTAAPPSAPASVASVPADPLLIGRLEIPRLGLEAMVRDGTDARTLRRAVGHIEGTARPGETGTVGIAGHRDTFFRDLRNVRKDDRIEIQTLSGTYKYSVDSIRIVEPSDVEVLASRPGERDLTLVTCYPFYYVGHAPKRFIVTATQLGS